MSLFARLQQALQQKTPLEVATLVACPAGEEACLGQMLLLYPDGRLEGELVDGALTAQVAAALRRQPWRGPAVLGAGREGYRIFWDRLLPACKAVLLGAGHISRALAQVLSLLDFELTVVDDRPDFADRRSFPPAAQVMCRDFAAALKELAPAVDERTAVIIATRGHQHDFACLRPLLAAGAGYLGLMGSRRRVAAMFRQLREEGVPAPLLDEVRAPVGLDLAAQTPAEIAVSIAAEVLAVFHGGTGRPLREQGGIRPWI